MCASVLWLFIEKIRATLFHFSIWLIGKELDKLFINKNVFYWSRLYVFIYLHLSISIANRWVENEIRRCKNIHQCYCIILQLEERQSNTVDKVRFKSDRETASTTAKISPYSFMKTGRELNTINITVWIRHTEEDMLLIFNVLFNCNLSFIWLGTLWFKYIETTVTKFSL